MKSLKLTKKTPEMIRVINVILAEISNTHQRLVANLLTTTANHLTIPAIRQKAWDDGVPGSNEAFNAPLVNLQEEADFLIKLAKSIKDYSQILLNKNPEEWN